MIFGIAAVISMMSISAGAREEMLRQLRGMGLSNLVIKAATPPGNQEGPQLGYVQGLVLADAGRLRRECLDIEGVEALKKFHMDVVFPTRKLGARVVGVTSGFFRATGLGLESGRSLSPEDAATFKQVCVLGSAVRKELFGLRPCVGKTLMLGNLSFQVVGVLRENSSSKGGPRAGGGSALRSRDTDEDICVPLETLAAKAVPRADADRVDEILVRVVSEKRVQACATAVKAALGRLHRGAADFEIVIPQELLKQQQKTQRVFNTVMGSIAAISLLVGGIGIMNIMLATVMERTKEIGLRRAVGATRTMIFRQFLVETSTLSGTGGSLGIILGLAGTRLISLYAGWETVVSWGSVVLAFGVSVGIGVLFGLYPAWRAAHFDPVKALKSE